jgi:hypothetical protein
MEAQARIEVARAQKSFKFFSVGDRQFSPQKAGDHVVAQTVTNIQIAR